ncbi:MAG: sulfurtransferase [Vicinamibacteria bacterium]|nr:sulfurtransferase [Vicinamibacteria bacterium]
MSAPVGPPLVSTGALAARLGSPRLRVVDVRWYLDPARRGREAYDAGHVPGAAFCDLEHDLAGPGGRRGGPLGRHPWPAPAHFARAMGQLGIDGETEVVAYDDAAGATAARLWYLLRAHGHGRVAVLDGGLGKWLAEGRSLETAVPAIPPTDFTPRFDPAFVVDKAELLARPPALVLDARAAERFRGEVEPIDPRAGHVPGAKSAPFVGNLTAGPLPVFRTPTELRARYEALGADREPPVVYCGSGVNACHDLLALELAGLSGRLYAGSWSEWSSDPALPVATGE